MMLDVASTALALILSFAETILQSPSKLMPPLPPLAPWQLTHLATIIALTAVNHCPAERCPTVTEPWVDVHPLASRTPMVYVP
jgi:hypothetical protein